MLASDDATIVRVTRGDWPQVEQQIYAIEKESFAPSIQERNETLRKEALSPTALVLALKAAKDGSVIGYLLADRLEQHGDVPGVPTDADFGRGNTLYIASVAVRPDWRGRGLGSALQRAAFAWAARHGYGRVAAHLRAGVAAKLGPEGKVLASFDDWYGTGEAYEYVAFPVR